MKRSRSTMSVTAAEKEETTSTSGMQPPCYPLHIAALQAMQSFEQSVHLRMRVKSEVALP
eukprot:1161558-Pelagomonas_calceolata.AAC.7